MVAVLYEMNATSMTASVNNTSARKGGRNACRTVTASSPVDHVLVRDDEPISNDPPRAVAVRRLDVHHGPRDLLVQRGCVGPLVRDDGQRCGGGSGVGKVTGVAVGSGVGNAKGVGVGSGVGKTMAVGVGSGVGKVTGVAVGTGVGSAMGVGVGSGVGKVMGAAVGSAMGAGKPATAVAIFAVVVASISSAEGPHPATTTSAASMMRTLAAPANITPATPARAAPAQVARVAPAQR